MQKIILTSTKPEQIICNRTQACKFLNIQNGKLDFFIKTEQFKMIEGYAWYADYLEEA